MHNLVKQGCSIYSSLAILEDCSMQGSHLQSATQSMLSTQKVLNGSMFYPSVTSYFLIYLVSAADCIFDKCMFALEQ